MLTGRRIGGGSLQHALDVLSEIKGFEHPSRMEPLRGLSNRVFLLGFGRDDYVFRLASPSAGRFGIDRHAEAEVLRLAERAGLGPEVVGHILPEGHLLTRKIAAVPFCDEPEKYREPDVLRRIARSVHAIHALPRIDHSFDPFARIRASFARADERPIPLPAGSGRILRRLDEIETARGPLEPPYIALCHNDLFAGNVLASDPIRFVDWEFAGMGDIFFDLATLVVATDESAPLPEEHRRTILAEYFGAATPEHGRRLDDMVFVVRLHVVAWGLTHHVLGTPDSHGWPGFTFLGFATELLEQLVSEL
jgi:thiamine kinase-like enzyme